MPDYRTIPLGVVENTLNEVLPWAITCVVLILVLALVLFQSFRTRRRMRRSLDRAEHMESLGRLAGGVAHDFNNMLSGILGASDLALDHADNNPLLRNQLELIHNSAGRAAELTQSLLTFSRRNPAMLKLVDLHKLLDNVLDLLTRSIDRRITLHRMFAAAEYMVLADSTPLQNLFLNLCVNARDAMPDGGTLSISTRNRTLDQTHRLRNLRVAPGKYIEICVSDTGTGIAAHILNHIFEPFFTTKESTKGSGMGLSSVYGVTQSHHGSIDVSSSPGHGSVFTVFLPVAHSPERPVEGIPATNLVEPPSSPMDPLRILVVDDEPSVRYVTVQILKSLGHEAIGAKEGRDALNLLTHAARPFDLAIVDMIMPDISGEDCARKLWEKQPKLRVIFASGFSHNYVESVLPSETQARFIQKPFSRMMLAETIESAMRNPSATDDRTNT